MRKRLFVLVLLLPAAYASACSAISPESVFFGQNDRNGDGAISRSEWRKATLPEGLTTAFTLGSRQDFRRLDRNRNGVLERGERDWYKDVRYLRHPCADWEERMRQMAQPQEASAAQ